MRVMDFPFVVVVLSFLFLFVAAQIGDQLRKRMLRLKEGEQHDFPDSGVNSNGGETDSVGTSNRLQFFHGREPLRPAQEL